MGKKNGLNDKKFSDEEIREISDANAKKLSPFLPPEKSPVWQVVCLPLLHYLESYRTWPQLEEWARKYRFNESVLRNMLAWLETRNLVVGGKNGWKAGSTARRRASS